MILVASWWVRRWLAFAGARTRLPAPLLPLVAVAWWLLLRHGVEHSSHGAAMVMSTPTEIAHWMLMVIAMMLPLLGPTLAEVRRTTYPPAHALAVAGYVLGWSLPWLLLALPVAGLRRLDVAHSPVIAGLAFLASAGWALSPWHARALVSCGLRRPLAPGGVPLLQSTAREGWHAGLACCVSCGPLMLACTLTGHSIIAMLGGFALGWLERSTYRPSIRIGASLALALGLWFLIFPAGPGPHHGPHHEHQRLTSLSCTGGPLGTGSSPSARHCAG
jgi:hypothetical protein